MKKRENENTRYYVELDLAAMTVVGWNFGQRDRLVLEKPATPSRHRIFISKGQYNKLRRHGLGLGIGAP